MSRFQLYIDEDAMDGDLVAALRTRGIRVITAVDAGLIGTPDPQQLAYATQCGCVLYAYNVSDFYRLHTLCTDRLPPTRSRPSVQSSKKTVSW